MNAPLEWRAPSYEFSASHTRSGVAGMLMCLPPSASTMAFITDGREPAQPAAPQPLAPSTLCLADIERVGHALWHLHAFAQPPGREIHDADAAVGADDGEAAGAELDVGSRGFERHAGDLLALVDHLIRGFDDCRARRHDRLGAA